MKIIIFLSFLLLSKASFSCSENLSSYPFECLAQDRFETINDSYNKIGLDPLELKGFKIQRIFGQEFYQNHKVELLVHHREILSQEKEWKFFQNAKSYLESLNSVFMTLPELLSLHQSIIKDQSPSTSPSDKGFFRNLLGFSSPKLNYKCEDKLLDIKTIKNLMVFEFKNDVGENLIELKNTKECEDPLFYKGTLVFIKGASVKFEMNRWLNEFNDMLFRYERGTAPKEISPYQFLADTKRYFLALRPFHTDSEEVINSLIDHSLVRLKLPPIFLIDDRPAYFVYKDDYRELFDQRVRTTISFFSDCLNHHLVGPAPLECTLL